MATIVWHKSEAAACERVNQRHYLRCRRCGSWASSAKTATLGGHVKTGQLRPFFQDNGRGSSFAFENTAASNSLEPRRSKAAARTTGHVDWRMAGGASWNGHGPRGGVSGVRHGPPCKLRRGHGRSSPGSTA